MQESKEGYRPNVAMVVINSQKKVLICRRRNTKTWQFPQGGIDKGEDIKNAMYRELLEEVGLKKEEVGMLVNLLRPYFMTFQKQLDQKFWVENLKDKNKNGFYLN